MVKTVQKVNYYNWSVLGDVYFTTAQIIAEEIERRYDPLFDQVAWGSKSLLQQKGSAHQADHLFVYPIVFNIKHAIEIYLKSFTVVTYGEINKHHDLKELFEKAEAVVRDTTDENNAKRFSKLWEVINKYYYGTYCEQNNGDLNNPDKKNEAERYPRESNQHYSLPQEEYTWLKKDLICSLIEDIKYLRSELRIYRNKIFHCKRQNDGKNPLN